MSSQSPIAILIGASFFSLFGARETKRETIPIVLHFFSLWCTRTYQETIIIITLVRFSIQETTIAKTVIGIVPEVAVQTI